jgi:L-fuculose-phosphate aldolase
VTVDVRFRIAAARRILYRAGCDSGVAGHVSARAEGEEAFWTTPFAYFDEALPEHTVKVGFDLTVLDGEMPTPWALAFHAALYQARPDVNAVIHTHSHYVSVLSTGARTVGMYHVESLIFHDDQAIYEDIGASPAEEVDRVVAALGDMRVLLMRHHGSIVVSDSLENATMEAITLEQAARYHLEADAAGGTEITSDAVIQARGGGTGVDFRQTTWEAHLRRLRRSDPDLFEP